MIKKSRLALAIGVTGALGLGAGSAMAVDFGATVQVQNSLEVINDGDLSFGVISIAETGIDGANEEVATMLLSPAGDVETGSSDDTVVDILSLGGEDPARGSVAFDSEGTDFTLEFEGMAHIAGIYEGDLDGDPSLGDFTFETGSTEVEPADVTAGYELSIGDPDAPAFYLVNMTVGDIDGGEVDTADDVHEPENGIWRVDSTFDSLEVGFGIGGTLITDPEVEGSYSETTYEGEFEVTARF